MIVIIYAIKSSSMNMRSNVKSANSEAVNLPRHFDMTAKPNLGNLKKELQNTIDRHFGEDAAASPNLDELQQNLQDIYDAYFGEGSKAKPDLNKLRDSLKSIFDHHFGEDALLKYYQGKVQVRKFDENDRPMNKNIPLKDENRNPVLDEEGNEIIEKKPWILTKKFALHYPHEVIADTLHLKLGKFHYKILEPYFMTLALEAWLEEPAYAALAEKLYEEFESTALEFVIEGEEPPTKEQLRLVTKEACTMVREMFQYMMPYSLKMADNIAYDKTGAATLRPYLETK